MRHFDLQQVGSCSWAAIARPGTGAGANAAFVLAEDGVVVFDTSLTPQAARELRGEAERYGRLRAVANTHWHGDHVRGNAVFAGVEILATETTAALIAERAVPQLERMKSVDPAEALAALEGDALATGREIAATIDELEQVVPSETFGAELDLGDIQLRALGGGHTASDAFALFSRDGVVVSGDLVVTGTHPWLGDGDPESWLRILDALEALDAATVVPGHGAVSELRSAVADVRAYLERMLSDPGSPPRPGWSWPEVHERNAEFLREKAERAEG